MTEEELKKKGEQINAANQQQTQQAPQPTNVPTPAAITDNNQSSVAQSVADMRQRAADYRDYASRPVTIDKSGQTNWLNEIERVRNQYVETPEQKAARERREKRDRRIASIADGLVAMSNVAGAMAGATPIKPTTTMSMAHKAAVDAAAKKRRENLNQYDIARRYYAGLQYKQDKDNADQLYKKAKARQDAGKQADLLDMNATKIEQAEARNVRADERAKEANELARQRAEETRRHNRRSESLQSERNNISRSKGDGNGGNGNSQVDWDEYAEWERQYPDEVNKIKEDNAQIDPWTHLPSKSVTSSTVRLVNAKMRQKYGSGGRKAVSGFGSSNSSGKKKIAGFGK